MNEAAQRVRADESEQPEHEQNYKDGPEHIYSFWLSLHSFVCDPFSALIDFAEFDSPDFQGIAGY